MTDKTQEQQDLTAIQKEYAEAVKRNQTAKARLENLLKPKRRNSHSKPQAPNQNIHSVQQSNSRTRHQTHLTTHLQSRRLQRQYDSLHTLAAYTKKIELIAERQHLYDDISLPISNPAPAGPKSYSNKDDGVNDSPDERKHEIETIKTQQRRVNSLLSTTKELTSNLELALVGARLDLKREQAQLLEATRHADTPTTERNGVGEQGEGVGKSANSDNNDDGIKLRALQATRAELQKWIAETLRRCEEEQPRPVEAAHDKTGHENGEAEYERIHANSREGRARLAVDVDADIEAEYTRYIAARKRLLHVLDALRKPLPAAATSVDTTIKAQAERNDTAPLGTQSTKTSNNQRPQFHRNHPSRVSLSYTTKTADFIRGPSLAEIEALHIPTHQHAKVTSAYLADVKRQTHGLDQRKLEMLNLLGHESHLLPAYPYQYHVGPKEMAGGEKKNKMGEEDATRLTRESVEIERLLEAWAFAAAAADAKLAEGVGRDVELAEMALSGAEAQLEDVVGLDGMRSEVMGGWVNE